MFPWLQDMDTTEKSSSEERLTFLGVESPSGRASLPRALFPHEYTSPSVQTSKLLSLRNGQHSQALRLR